MDLDSQQMVSRYSRRRSRLYRLLRPPCMFVDNREEKFLPHCEGFKLFIGGAGSVAPSGFLNLDIEYFPGVDLVADVEALPLGTDSVAAIECDAVLEHVRDPVRAVTELLRVLRPGGFLHIVVPFCHPFHGYPSDYQRWTTKGLDRLFSSERCEVIDIGLRTGPTATLLAMACEYAKLVGGRVAYVALAWILWPLRYLDLWLNRKPQAYVLANHLYALLRKK
jgi:SAM-dependent methyltransferase